MCIRDSIKDVQKLIQKKGAGRVVELGRSLERAAREKPVTETDLLPPRIKPADTSAKAKPVAAAPVQKPIQKPPPSPIPPPTPAPVPKPIFADKGALEEALKKLEAIKARWSDFRAAGNIE